MFELTNPDLGNRPDKLNRLYLELQRFSEHQNALTVSIDPVRRYSIGFMSVSHTEVHQQFASKIVTEVRVGTFLDMAVDDDIFSKSRLTREYIFRSEGQAEIITRHQNGRRMEDPDAALVDLLEHLAQGMKLLIEDAQAKLRSLEETRDALRRTSLAG